MTLCEKVRTSRNVLSGNVKKLMVVLTKIAKHVYTHSNTQVLWEEVQRDLALTEKEAEVKIAMQFTETQYKSKVGEVLWR